ncbi:GntR family transcriptional regulator [Vibrio xiamenensis]|uniref:GntR family transcriptional regulator n=1 Tax=Vibrio xiamenensis TaxID=861298 RepID=A0A1G7XJP7_9VIBR|nr:GntR family transcriptional regulator [Vibrio xiamenensis]SDG84336.1 GntR family transcriptional regulator [Vibrio xiamenensis]
MQDWSDDQPIFRQLAQRVSKQILQGTWPEGSALPSVRSVSADLKINHLTVLKAYQLLVDDGLVEKRRGQGMYVCVGAQAQLLAEQKQQFIETQIPDIAATLRQVQMSMDEFISRLSQHIEGDE